ncbi:MAG TPA: DUF6596 domain-containing protein [Candidatus Baltobacteraceae bacterium]|nr:DUF6596 domain-containing protein [Candidatus Baltobacteraceae bacterium]
MISTIDATLRELTPLIIGTVTRRYGDFSGAEDAVQEALIAAATQWPHSGVPDNPRVWLTQVALRRMVDRIRSDSARRAREAHAADAWVRDRTTDDAEPQSEEDDTLTLFFMCCHPALTTASSIALTLRAVGGLTTGEIAAAFFVPEATMAQRISRAKQTIRSSGAQFALPKADERTSRLPAVLHVLCLIFNEGYASSAGQSLQRLDLSSEAIRLARMLRALQPDDGEAAGLLALMLLTDARRPARIGSIGELIPLGEQDRSLWIEAEISEGIALLSNVLPAGKVGPYQLQAAIAAVHDEARSAEKTDWAQILALYDLLQEVSDNPMITLSRAVADAMVHGPERALQRVETLTSDPRLGKHHRVDAVRAHLLELSGRTQAAAEHFRSAAKKTNSVPERNYLLTKAARLSDGTTCS